MKYSLNVKGVVDHLGGVEKVAARMSAADIKCGVKAIQKWLERQMIPMTRWLSLKEMAETDGKTLVLENFLVAQPAPTSNLDITKVSVAELHELLRAAELEIAAAAKAAAPIKAELGRRFTDGVKAAFTAAGKQHGVVRVPLGGGFEAEAEAKKDVKWDSAKLMAVASTMTWEQAQKVFKIEFAVPEKIYGALDAANPALKTQIDAARTVTYGAPKITLNAPKAAA